MSLKQLVLGSSQSRLSRMGGLHTTCTFQTSPPTLHSWPGDTKFDDEDEEEFEDWDGTEDLPGLRTLHSAAISLRGHETTHLDS
jgi:hypothetical protein